MEVIITIRRRRLGNIIILDTDGKVVCSINGITAQLIMTNLREAFNSDLLEDKQGQIQKVFVSGDSQYMDSIIQQIEGFFPQALVIERPLM